MMEERDFNLSIFEMVDNMLELRKTTRVHLSIGCRPETITPYSKGFVLAGAGGFFSV